MNEIENKLCEFYLNMQEIFLRFAYLKITFSKHLQIIIMFEPLFAFHDILLNMTFQLL